jgi:hypothetical protein
MMRASNARIFGSGLLAVCALIATLYVLDESTLSAHEAVVKGDELSGDSLLRTEANVLDALDHVDQGKSSFDMLHDYQKPGEDTELTKQLEAAAPQTDDLDVAFSPDKLGLVKFKKGKAVFEPPADEEDYLIQVDDWEPHGQEELADQIEAAKTKEEQSTLKADGMEGDDVISAAGVGQDMDKDSMFETVFVQESATEWQPAGQESLGNAISAAHDEDEAAQVKADGLEGDGVFSAAGIRTADEEESDDFVNELSLLQTQASADWVPQGQSNLGSQIKAASQEEEENQIKEDGLKGDTMMAAAGIEEEEEESILLQNDAVSDWSPKGQQIKGAQEATNNEEATDKQKEHEKTLDDGIYGDDLLSAAGMGDHKRSTDEAGELGTITSDDLDVNDLLSN